MYMFLSDIDSRNENTSLKAASVISLIVRLNFVRSHVKLFAEEFELLFYANNCVLK